MPAGVHKNKRRESGESRDATIEPAVCPRPLSTVPGLESLDLSPRNGERSSGGWCSSRPAKREGFECYMIMIHDTKSTAAREQRARALVATARQLSPLLLSSSLLARALHADGIAMDEGGPYGVGCTRRLRGGHAEGPQGGRRRGAAACLMSCSAARQAVSHSRARGPEAGVGFGKRGYSDVCITLRTCPS